VAVAGRRRGPWRGLVPLYCRRPLPLTLPLPIQIESSHRIIAASDSLCHLSLSRENLPGGFPWRSRSGPSGQRPAENLTGDNPAGQGQGQPREKAERESQRGQDKRRKTRRSLLTIIKSRARRPHLTRPCPCPSPQGPAPRCSLHSAAQWRPSSGTGSCHSCPSSPRPSRGRYCAPPPPRARALARSASGTSPRGSTTARGTGEGGAPSVVALPALAWRLATCSRAAGCTTTRCRCTTRRGAPSWSRSSTARSTAGPTSCTSSTGGARRPASSRGTPCSPPSIESNRISARQEPSARAAPRAVQCSLCWS
jgi:hypothetical protein